MLYLPCWFWQGCHDIPNKGARILVSNTKNILNKTLINYVFWTEMWVESICPINLPQFILERNERDIIRHT